MRKRVDLVGYTRVALAALALVGGAAPQAVESSPFSHEPPVCFASVHYGVEGFAPPPSAACFSSLGDAYANLNPLFSCTPSGSNGAVPGDYQWTCKVTNGCEAVGVETVALLGDGAPAPAPPGASVDARVWCEQPDLFPLTSASTADSTTRLDRDTGTKSSTGTYVCTLTFNVVPNPLTHRFDGQAWCRDT